MSGNRLNLPAPIVRAAEDLYRCCDAYNDTCRGSDQQGDDLDSDGLCVALGNLVRAAGVLKSRVENAKVGDEETIGTAFATLAGFCDDVLRRGSVLEWEINTKRIQEVLSRCELPLTKFQQKVLLVMYELKLDQAEAATSAEDVFRAARFEKGDPKDVFAALRERRYVNAGKGRGSGYWLTASGIRVGKLLYERK